MYYFKMHADKIGPSCRAVLTQESFELETSANVPGGVDMLPADCPRVMRCGMMEELKRCSTVRRLVEV
jgi:hypothetical protein